MKTKIYLWVNGDGWMPFILEDSEKELKDRNIQIGHYANIGDYAKIGEKIIVTNRIYLYGSGHSVSYWGENKIQIGCIGKPIEEWQDNFERIGKIESYSDEQIKEYKSYIDMIAMFHKSNL